MTTWQAIKVLVWTTDPFVIAAIAYVVGLVSLPLGRGALAWVRA